MTSFRTTLTLLFLAALLLAAGCVSQGSGNQTSLLPQEKYVVLIHTADYSYVPGSGSCLHMDWVITSDAQFNEKKGVLTDRPDNYGQFNASLILFYLYKLERYGSGDNNTVDQDYYGNGQGVYSLPSKPFERVTIDSVTGDGIVTLRVYNESIVLKSKEHWENKTQGTPHLCDLCLFSLNCSEQTIFTDRIYNAGVFDKSAIKVRETYQYTPVIPNRTATDWIRTYNNNLTPAQRKIPYEILQFIDADYPKEYVSFTKKELEAGYYFIPEANASQKFNISEKTAMEHGGEIKVRIDLEPAASLDVVDSYATRIESRDKRNHCIFAWVGLNTIGEIALLPDVKEIRPITPLLTISR